MRILSVIILFFFGMGLSVQAENLIMKRSYHKTGERKINYQQKNDKIAINFDKDGPIRSAYRNGRKFEWKLYDISEVRPECVMDASEKFKVPVSLILTIMDVEGGEVGGRELNKNGTWDMGPMQINTCHMEEIAPFGITRHEIETNGCLNVQIGTWLLKKHLKATNGNVLEAIGRYHSNNQPYKSRYQSKAINAYKTLKTDPIKHIKRILGKANSIFTSMGDKLVSLKSSDKKK